MIAPLTSNKLHSGSGFSMLELLIVITMIGVVTGFALLQVVRARQLIIRANAAQQLAAHLEKARLDSIRRRPTAPAQMAQVSIINSDYYTVTIDTDGDGSLNAPQVVRLPTDASLQFTGGTFPRTIYFNWRGRTVDSSDAIVPPTTITISSPVYGSTTINVSDAGQPTIGAAPTSSPVTNSTPPAPSFRDNTQIP